MHMTIARALKNISEYETSINNRYSRQKKNRTEKSVSGTHENSFKLLTDLPEDFFKMPILPHTV